MSKHSLSNVSSPFLATFLALLLYTAQIELQIAAEQIMRIIGDLNYTCLSVKKDYPAR